MPTTRNLSLAGLLNDAIERWVTERVYTALPGRVERFDEIKNAVDVKPLTREPVELEDGSTVYESLPVIPNVPLMQFGMGGMRITFPAAQGDTVLLIFARRSLDKWKTYGGDVETDARLFNLSDAVAIPGLLPFASPWKGTSRTDMTMGKDGGPQIHVTASEIKLGGSEATDKVATAEKVLAELNALKSTFDTWTPVPGDGGSALKALLTTLFATWPSLPGSSLARVKP